jgi:hypothetical protein
MLLGCLRDANKAHWSSWLQLRTADSRSARSLVTGYRPILDAAKSLAVDSDIEVGHPLSLSFGPVVLFRAGAVLRCCAAGNPPVAGRVWTLLFRSWHANFLPTRLLALRPCSNKTLVGFASSL